MCFSVFSIDKASIVRISFFLVHRVDSPHEVVNLASMIAVLAIQNVAFDGIIFAGQILEDLLQSIGLDDFVGNHHVMFRAEVDAILRLLNSTDNAAGDAEAAKDERPLNDLMRCAHNAQLDDSPAQGQQGQIMRDLEE